MKLQPQYVEIGAWDESGFSQIMIQIADLSDMLYGHKKTGQ